MDCLTTGTPSLSITDCHQRPSDSLVEGGGLTPLQEWQSVYSTAPADEFARTNYSFSEKGIVHLIFTLLEEKSEQQDFI